MRSTRETEQPAGERPCTAEQGQAASRIVMDVAFKRITVDEGHRRMAAVFGEEAHEEPKAIGQKNTDS